MSLVTPQGQAARAKQIHLIANIKKELIQFLSHRDMTPTQIVEFYNRALEFEVRAAMWELLDEKITVLTVDRTFQLAIKTAK